MKLHAIEKLARELVPGFRYVTIHFDAGGTSYWVIQFTPDAGAWAMTALSSIQVETSFPDHVVRDRIERAIAEARRLAV